MAYASYAYYIDTRYVCQEYVLCGLKSKQSRANDTMMPHIGLSRLTSGREATNSLTAMILVQIVETPFVQGARLRMQSTQILPE